MTPQNRLLAFAFDNQVAHGAIVHIDEGVADFLSSRAYAPDVARLLGEVITAMPLMATHLRFDGCINLQFQGEGAVTMLVGQIDHHLQVRAMAKAVPDARGDFTDLLKGGLLALMLEPSDPAQPSSQATVEILGQSLGEALQVYFSQSEQLPTLIRLAVRGEKLAAFMLQRLPLQGAQGTEEDWDRLWTLASTLGADELLDTDEYTLLQRLFNEEVVRTFEPRAVDVACRCSRAGISRMLLSLGEPEVKEILAEQNRVAVTCEFCGREQVFTPHEALDLFRAAEKMAPEDDTRH